MTEILTASTNRLAECHYEQYSTSESNIFDIRDYLDCIEKSPKSKSKYFCPVCGGSNLDIDLKSGKYRCFSNECDSRDIREAIAPWADSPRNRKNSGEQKTYNRKPEPKIMPQPAPIPETVDLATFTPTDFPEIREGKIIYPYSNRQWVERVNLPDGGKKILPFHSGSEKAGKGEEPWLMYRESEAIAHGLGKFVSMAEGEKCVESLRSVGLVGLTFQGGSWTENDIESAILRLKKAGIAGIAYFPDNDDAGFKKAEKIQAACNKWNMPYVGILPKKLEITAMKGDIHDYIKEKTESGMTPEQIRENLEKIFRESADEERLMNQRLMEIIHHTDFTAAESTPPFTKKKAPDPATIAESLSQMWKGKFAYDQLAGKWRQWDGCFWKGLKNEDIRAEIYDHLCQNQYKKFTSAYIKDVQELLTMGSLRVAEWKTPPSNKINFFNGILDLATNSLEPHNPDYGFVTCIDRDYQIIEKGDPLTLLKEYAPVFSEWIDYAFYGDKNQKIKIMGMMAAIIRGDFAKTQKFIQYIGGPGTGKGTFLRLLGKMVGKEAAGTSSLRNLCASGTQGLYALSAIIDKSLVVCPDEKKVTENLEIVNQLCGGDDLSFREPYGKVVGNKPFYGTLAVASNRYPYKGDTAGLDRRLFLIEMNRKIQKKDIHFEEKLEKELGAITSIALLIPPEKVLEIISSNDGSSFLAWKLKQDNCSVAAWMESNLVIDPNIKGVHLTELSGNFKKWCEETGETYCAPKKFSTLIGEYCEEIFGYTVTKGSRTRIGVTLNGVRLAQFSDLPMSNLLAGDVGVDGVESVEDSTPASNPDSEAISDNADVDGVESVEDSTPAETFAQKDFQPAGVASVEKTQTFFLKNLLPTYTNENIKEIISDLCRAPDKQTLDLLSDAYCQGNPELKQRVWAMMTPEQKAKVKEIGKT